MFLRIPRYRSDIQDKYRRSARHDQLHYSSKLAQHITQAEAEYLEPPLPLACDKRRFVTVTLVDLGLPIPQWRLQLLKY